MVMKFSDNLMNIIFPRRCIACRDLLILGNHKWLCENCHGEFVFVKEKCEYCCEKCGRPIENSGKCAFCNTQNIYYDTGGCLYSYKAGVRDAFGRFKFRNRPDYAEFFAGEMAKNFFGNVSDYDYVTAVPMFPKKQKQRGYNQSEKLALTFSKVTGIKYNTVLAKIKDTEPQRSLDKEHRQKNIKNAFAVTQDVKGKNILLIDDVITTGNTVNECCRVLKKAGAERVDFYTLCSRDRE
jgi:ComF family protein